MFLVAAEVGFVDIFDNVFDDVFDDVSDDPLQWRACCDFMEKQRVLGPMMR